MEKEEIIVHAYDWMVEDNYTEDGHLTIHAWCLDRESNPYLVRINDFPTFFNVELPLFVDGRSTRWTKSMADHLVRQLQMSLGEDGPEKGIFSESSKLYYYRGERKYPMILMAFRTIKAMEFCEKLLEKPQKIDGIGMVACRVWESQIPLVRKLLTIRKCNYSQWFKIEGKNTFLWAIFT